jgi:hypothetical protein
MNFGGSARQSGWPSHSQGKKGTLPDMRRAPPQAIAESSRTGTGVQGGYGGYSGICRRIPGGSSPCVVPGSLSVAVLESGNGQSGGMWGQRECASARRSGVTPKGRDCLALLQDLLTFCFPRNMEPTTTQHSRLVIRRNEKEKKEPSHFMTCTANYRSSRYYAGFNPSADLMGSDFNSVG